MKLLIFLLFVLLILIVLSGLLSSGAIDYKPLDILHSLLAIARIGK